MSRPYWVDQRSAFAIHTRWLRRNHVFSWFTSPRALRWRPLLVLFSWSLFLSIEYIYIYIYIYMWYTHWLSLSHSPSLSLRQIAYNAIHCKKIKYRLKKKILLHLMMLCFATSHTSDNWLID
jgi:hypothetical protein